MHKIRFTPRGKRDLKKLSVKIRKRIIDKIGDNAELENPLVRAKSLINLPPATHRFRVGQYRVFFFIEQKIIFIERIRHRREAYK